jgi:FAD dependent oxidoreductase
MVPEIICVAGFIYSLFPRSINRSTMCSLTLDFLPQSNWFASHVSHSHCRSWNHRRFNSLFSKPFCFSQTGPYHYNSRSKSSSPASGASGKAAGVIARGWTGSATASLESLSFQLHQELAHQHGGAEKWGYRSCRALAVTAGNKTDDSPDIRWG